MPSIGGAYIPVDPNALSSGESTFPRDESSASITQTTQVLRLAFFTAQKSQTVASLRSMTSSTAAGATPSVVRLGLYTVNADGDITLVASTANDTALYASGNTVYTKALSDAYATTAGLRYAVGVLVVTAATAPTICGVTVTTATAEAASAPRIAAAVTGQADLPASVVAGSLTNANLAPYVALVP